MKKEDTFYLLGLLDGSPAPAQVPPVDAMAAMGMGMGMGSPVAAAGPPGAMQFVVFDKNGLMVNFNATKDPNNQSVTCIEATFTNSLPTPIQALNFQVAVPKYMKLQMQPASSQVVPPGQSSSVKQLFKVANSLQGQKPVLLRLKIDCSINGQPSSEMGQVDQFPPTY